MADGCPDDAHTQEQARQQAEAAQRQAQEQARLQAEAAQRQAQPGVTRVWCWAPGWLTKNGRDDDNIFRTTGFNARRIPEAWPEATSTPAGKALGFPDSWKGLWKVDPLFAVEATEEETLARWPDGSAAVAIHKAGTGYEVFCGIPALPTKVLAGFARLAGCRLHAEPDTAYVREAEGQVFVEPLDDVMAHATTRCFQIAPSGDL